MWQDNGAVKIIKKQWLTEANYRACKNDTTSSVCYDTSGDTAETYCSQLSLGGYEDWRLPTIAELENIVDYTHDEPTMDTEKFKNISLNTYWSSNSHITLLDHAWFVNFETAKVEAIDKHVHAYIRCVRKE